jgi:hypothetical protein
VDWIHVPQDRVQRRAVVNTVKKKNYGVPQTAVFLQQPSGSQLIGAFV